MKPDFDFEPDRQKEEEKKLNSIVGKLTEAEIAQVYHDGKLIIAHAQRDLISISIYFLLIIAWKVSVPVTVIDFLVTTKNFWAKFANIKCFTTVL